MKKNISDLSGEELHKDLKSKKNLLIFNILLLMIIIFSSLTITIIKGVGVYILMPFAFGFFSFLSWKNYDNLRKELKIRKSEY